jgi:hypothetical protein
VRWTHSIGLVAVAACGPRVVAPPESQGTGGTIGAPIETSTTLAGGDDSPGADASGGASDGGGVSSGSDASDDPGADGRTPSPDLGWVCPVDWLPEVCWGADCEDNFRCGDLSSRLDADGCPRTECTVDADCERGRHCSPRLLAGKICYHESCQAFGFPPTCLCGGATGCFGDPRGFCIDATEFPPDEVCAASHVTCENLVDRIGTTHGDVADFMDMIAPPLQARVAECQSVRIERAIDECGVAPCDVLLWIAGYCGNDPAWAEMCAAAGDEAATTLAHLIVAQHGGCPSCDTCAAASNDLCAQFFDCSG